MKFLFVGDASLGEHYFSFGHGPATLSAKRNIFSEVDFLFKGADYVCANLECVISDFHLNKNDPESVVFRAPPVIANQLSESGINLLHVANNHILQHGKEVFFDTLENLKKKSIDYIGLKDQDWQVYEKDGVSVAILAFSDVPDNKYSDQIFYENMNIESISEKIKKIKGSVDWVVLSIHWGLENTVEPLPEQKKVAEKYRMAGADIIIGHHPHIIFPVEINDKYLCAWSMGNFVFDLPWDRRMTSSAVLDVDLKKDSFFVKAHCFDLDSNGLPKKIKKTIPLHEGKNYIYNHSPIFRFYNFVKFRYFFLNLLKGNTRLKCIFLARKIINKIWR